MRAQSDSLNRRQFTRLFALGGSAALMSHPAFGAERPASLPASAPERPTDGFWHDVRSQFLMPADLAVLNAANLCPSPVSVLEAMYANTKRLDKDPVPSFRNEMHDVKESTRKLLAEFLRVTPEEIVITRNTSEANNLVSSGVELKAGDEVVIFEDNHPSNNMAWKEKAKRFGFSVTQIPQVNPHPGPEHYLEAAKKAITAKTKLLALTHLSSTVGDLYPAKELCALARERGVLSLVDGAQSVGLLDLNLAEVQPDFYTGSSHKWACGPMETGVLYINARSQSKIWPSIYSAYPGAVGISKTFEGMGQRDEPAIMAFGEGIKFQQKVGKANIEARSRELTQALLAGLRKIAGVTIWTSPEPSRTVAVVSFQPGSLDANALATALEHDGIVCATRGGTDRPGIRFSPHFYNSMNDIEKAVRAVDKYMRSGV